MKIILILFLLTTNILVFSQGFGLENYKVDKIYEDDKYYLIFLSKNNFRYTIFSEKGIALQGEKIKVDSIYKFDLVPIKDTLSPVNYLDYRRFPQFSNDEIGLLCHAKNLIGINITPVSDVKKKKHKWFKKTKRNLQ
jgi:hypothetical protein